VNSAVFFCSQGTRLGQRKILDHFYMKTRTPHLATKLKKEYSYTSTPAWAFMACYRVNFLTYRKPQEFFKICVAWMISIFPGIQMECYPTKLHKLITYSYAPHNDVSVNDGPHIRGWSHNILILYDNTIVLQLPTVFSTVTCCTGL
jgi:hypothetical protein